MIKRAKFDKGIDEILLANDFKYYGDWKYGPQCGWSENWDHITLILTRHDFGYDICFQRHASGSNPRMIIGVSNSAQEIIALRDLLKKLAKLKEIEA